MGVCNEGGGEGHVLLGVCTQLAGATCLYIGANIHVQF